MSRGWFVPVTFVLLTAVPVASAHAQPLPTPGGRLIEAADGDVVVVPSGARVAIVTRTQVQARLVYGGAADTAAPDRSRAGLRRGNARGEGLP